ncbi:hypothetical protein BUALT_Bualt12G0130900 [Buddleja alternifolia]|uniref:Membrane-associated kinase regulator 1 n=1 Tax=Buddleja alternifolia TaxID=168488 RepID=A0AAV6WYX9_9LAMI|nr:hypothetical protein BUALT_Bualt12G0130900 [Buddleja alternifolia]
MGQRRRHPTTKSHTLPSSPTHSSSSSDFEFTISLSPRKSSAALCPADELFYKGQLLPLHLSPRLSMVRTLLLSSASTSSSSDTTTTASRASTDSSSADDSSRPSSVTDDELKRLTINKKPPSKYFSLSKFSSVFRKEHKDAAPPSSGGGAAVKRVIRKYFNKVKPLYEKLSQKQQQQHQPFYEKPTQKQQQQQQLQQPLYEKLPQKQQQQQQQQKVSRPSSKFWTSANTTICMRRDRNYKDPMDNARTNIPLSFSGNLRYPIRRRSCISSCPSSMGSSPSHGKSGFGSTQMSATGSGTFNSDSSSMEELQSAIQGAITHCKNSMLQNNKTG